ncbi:ribonuclease HI [Actinoallomurus sp. NPDC050550]|uniref:ribonuclease HI n=1 Tax=Actinoallomurus sp. NPDC050550 TaxID=3154937 RepID=UPI0033E289D0
MDIYTDGGCVPNPGPGGWGVVLRYGPHHKEIWGGEPAETTNNRMELMAACRALESLTRPALVRLHTDSQYLRRGITEWVPRWRANGWMTAAKQPVKNADLWRRLEAELRSRRSSCTVPCAGGAGW